MIDFANSCVTFFRVKDEVRRRVRGETARLQLNNLRIEYRRRGSPLYRRQDTCGLSTGSVPAPPGRGGKEDELTMEHIEIHKSADYHCSFPSVCRLQNGDLIVVFREAPQRPGADVHMTAEKLSHRHVDPDTRIALVRSADDGRTWNRDSRVVIDESHGKYDLNMAVASQISSGELIVNTHRWTVNPDIKQMAALDGKRWRYDSRESRFGPVFFDTLYFLRSGDGGGTWGDPEPFGFGSLKYYSHGGRTGIVEMPDGSWLLPLHGFCAADGERTGFRAYVVRSRDRGETWGEPSTVMHSPDRRLGFVEPPMVRLPDGRLLMVALTYGAGGTRYQYQAFSNDDGLTWQGLKRSPLPGYTSHLLALRDGRVLCTYGYKRDPEYGIHGTVSEDGGETWDTDNEIVIRSGEVLHLDFGYPSSIQLEDGHVLTTYYYHGEDEVRYIAGSIYTV